MSYSTPFGPGMAGILLCVFVAGALALFPASLSVGQTRGDREEQLQNFREISRGRGSAPAPEPETVPERTREDEAVSEDLPEAPEEEVSAELSGDWGSKLGLRLDIQQLGDTATRGRERFDRVQFNVRVQDPLGATTATKLTAHVFVIAQSARNRQQYRIVSHEVSPVGELGRRDTFRWATPVREVGPYQATGNTDGYRFGGWVLVVTDESGDAVAARASNPTWTQRLDNLSRAFPGERVYDVDLNPY